ncbi:group 1 glycosyl transferase [Fictibacillus macauensis ZFHKF-1]|uniref:Group 1 glycosyl transferase n=1 Tax=Fictibacillus macauensis ZFHKF-1 TaxID=1196324 RepID=I8ALN7_9BACL|nr:glycosyltransferase family 1 protein [Fictibacillus macauensis]EIT86534.1 group 1 glycosyl transferase [Fictibacillus macauensis ZFHKF-1]
MNEWKQPKRVLHVVSQMDRGGAETLLMNVYRTINRSHIQFDFVTHGEGSGDFDAEIKALGGNIYPMKSLGSVGPVTYVKNLKALMKTNAYSAVHAHTDYQSGFPLAAARLANIPRRISHSHSTSWPNGDGLKQRVILQGLRTLISWGATQNCSCSSEAGAFLFPNKAVTILNNGLDVVTTRVDREAAKEALYTELALPTHTRLIGHVGRFSASKNQRFLLPILKILIHQDPNVMCVFVGDGPLREEIEEEARQAGLSDHVRFLGVREDIATIMKALDVFLFPSLFEGFGIVAIEAQRAGTPCVLADTVPQSTDMGIGLTQYESLQAPVTTWVEHIRSAMRKHRPTECTVVDAITDRGFNIQENVQEWVKLYGISEAKK